MGSFSVSQCDSGHNTLQPNLSMPRSRREQGGKGIYSGDDEDGEAS
jgi:hypothetical protein